MCKDQFLTSHMPIFEYQSPKHKARVFIIRYCQNFGGGGEVGGFGGEASPPHPPVDETLCNMHSGHSNT